ncbi:hypothetical protein BofuT4_uP099690.1 [Botrytis cinerea T4]|uniref:Uncharacterized protein n=1 Tax=Botryotinia fuckeliana (strain T4) TaxID=999810 RepID=G2YC18_BOTF4|nr:hypothetical protein BofuT4_uP099690.1 [Botrytis cinerea T4]
MPASLSLAILASAAEDNYSTVNPSFRASLLIPRLASPRLIPIFKSSHDVIMRG